MSQEERDLLIKELCARLPYGVIVQVNDGLKGIYDRRLVQVFCDRVSCSVNVYNPLKDCICIDSVKPYLRPLSSMTEEENDEWRDNWYPNLFKSVEVKQYESQEYLALSHSDSIRWLNEHMFDYNELIPKGLALEAPEGMYKNIPMKLNEEI